MFESILPRLGVFAPRPSRRLWKYAAVEESKSTFEEDATLQLAVMTAAIGLFVQLGLLEPPEDGSPAHSK